MGHKPCVWDGKSYAVYNSNIMVHRRSCIANNGHRAISYSYYLNKYGQGKLYMMQEENVEDKNIEDDKSLERCELADGTKITCQNGGTCVKCGVSLGKGVHSLIADTEKGIYCLYCGKSYGAYSETVTRDANFPPNNTIIGTFSLKNGATFIDNGSIDNNPSLDSYTLAVNSVNQTRTEFSLIGKFRYISTKKDPGFIGFKDIRINVNGIYCYLLKRKTKIYTDTIEPVISNIQVVESEWTKSKPIAIKGTENWADTVNVKIENDRGRVVFEGGANVTNNNWSVSCTPELEAGENNRTFTVTVTDSCENSISKDFNISRVDGRPPTVTSSDKATDSEWAKEKTFTFTAEDLGIGNVEIAFNDVNDYSPAVKEGTNYSKEYKFVGDAYSPVQASVYFKDGLGNITTQVVTLEKIDNTIPTITNASLNNNIVNITAHDRHNILGEGSGVVKYRYITSTEKLENPEITENNSQEVSKNELFTIPNINEVKYIYVVAEDLVGNISESYEIEVPKITLTNNVNEQGANGKGEVLLDWTGYDITNKYFVIYRKQEDEEEWTTIVGKEERFNGSTYTDNLGNDVKKPILSETTIEKDIENNQIKITPTSSDRGTKYVYYIESYDVATNALIAISNIN